jgi:ATP-binding cassette subfamily B protein
MKYFFPRLLHLPMPFFDSRKIGDLTARLNDTARIQRVVTQIVSGAIIQLLVVVVSITFLFTYSGTIAVSTLVISPIFFVLAFLYRHQILTKQNVVMQGNALTEANYISTIQGIGAIKNHNQQSDFAKQNEQVYGGYQEAILQLGKLQIKISLLVNVSSNLFLMVLLAYGSSLVLSGQMKAGELMATLSLAGGILPGVAGLA